MKWIVACDREGGIGKERKASRQGFLPDMKYFRQQDSGKDGDHGAEHTGILSRRKVPLPDRRNIVLSRRLPESGSYEVCRSEAELLELVKAEDPQDLFVIGGGQIYRLLLPYCDEALVTEIDAVCAADTFIPLLSKDPEWKCVSKSEPVFRERE